MLDRSKTFFIIFTHSNAAILHVLPKEIKVTVRNLAMHRVRFTLRHGQAELWISQSIITFDDMASLLIYSHHGEIYANDFKS